MRGYLMKKNILFFIILIIILSLFFISSAQEGINESAILNIFYGEFKDIEYFNFIYVSIDGSAEKIGLNSEELTKYAKLKFKNNFAYIEYKDIQLQDNASESEKKKKGSLWIKVWTVGENYPVAYHIKCKAGNYFDYFWEQEVLGYGSKENVPNSIKESVGELIEQLAIDFFTTRGEL
jgi:hypothetical protein